MLVVLDTATTLYCVAIDGAKLDVSCHEEDGRVEIVYHRADLGERFGIHHTICVERLEVF